MYIIGERINGMFKSVKKAIQERDASVIQDLAKRQVAGGAKALDLNVGPAVSDAEGAMLWLAECVREVDPVTPLAVDTAKWEVMEAVVPKKTSFASQDGLFASHTTRVTPGIGSG